jgi:hypothetical protein
VAAKAVAWVLAFILSVLIIASRKHYTVDVVIAWYVVPLVFLALERTYITKRNDEDVAKWIALESIKILDGRPSNPNGRISEGSKGEASSQDYQLDNSREVSEQYYDSASPANTPLPRTT